MDAPASDYIGAVAVTAHDLAGTWQWQETSQIDARPAAAALLGTLPEGPITRITCVSAGVLTLAAVAQSFVACTTQEFPECSGRYDRKGRFCRNGQEIFVT